MKKQPKIGSYVRPFGKLGATHVAYGATPTMLSWVKEKRRLLVFADPLRGSGVLAGPPETSAAMAYYFHLDDVRQVLAPKKVAR